MNILSLDTSTEYCSVALMYQGKVFERISMAQNSHSYLILGLIDALFIESRATIAEIDVVAVGRGPGSFSGVRIGVGVTQGIAFARDIPVVAISSLTAIAQGTIKESHADYISVAMDARMGEIYGANFQVIDGLAILLDKEQVCVPKGFKFIKRREWVGAGTGWVKYESTLTDNFAGQLKEINSCCFPKASSIIKLAQNEVKMGRLLSAWQALPVYLRNNIAKKKGE